MQAQAELQSISDRLATLYPGTDIGRIALVKGLQDTIVKGTRSSLLVLAGAVACLLLIACANVANLTLARATLRSKEVAVRTAIGASRIVILRQVLTESVLLAVIGGVSGLLLAVWGTDFLLAIAPRALPRVHDITLDWRVVTFTALVTIGTGLLFGIMPALQLSGSDLNGTLKEGGRSVTGPGSANRTRSALVIAEVALSLILLAGAGLLSATLLRLQHVEPGFQSRNVLTTALSLPDAKYKKDAQTDRLLRPRVLLVLGVGKRKRRRQHVGKLEAGFYVLQPRAASRSVTRRLRGESATARPQTSADTVQVRFQGPVTDRPPSLSVPLRWSHSTGAPGLMPNGGSPPIITWRG